MSYLIHTSEKQQSELEVEHHRDDNTLHESPPPPYPSRPEVAELYSPEIPRRHRSWNPRIWSRKTWIWSCVGTIVVVIVTLIIVIAVPVMFQKNNRYPAYGKINYKLQDTFQGPSFFDNFNYFTGYDPSQGFVHYVDQPGSQALSLTSVISNTAILKVDTVEQNASTGRKSVRLESKKQYNSGLFIFDILHTPYGCGTWPALWLTDPTNWPRNGEIDVVEAVNQAVSGNQMTLHTTGDCTMSTKRLQTGINLADNCLNSTNNNAGCGVQGPAYTYGPSFNANGGGVYAMELRSDGIRIWFFPRSAIPVDISNTGSTGPDPSSWGTALADFPNTSCDISSHFANMSIIANIDLCGSWAGSDSVYITQDRCPGLCTDLVALNPGAFGEAFWQFGSFKVYQAAS